MSVTDARWSPMRYWRGRIDVWRILSAAPVKSHSFTSFARVDGASITYPGVV